MPSVTAFDFEKKMDRLDLLRTTLPNRVMTYKPVVIPYRKAPKSDHVALRVTGGIGDLVIGVGVAEAIAERCGSTIIYSKWPEIASLFTLLPCKNEKVIQENGLDVILNLNSLVIFQFARNFGGFSNKKLFDLYLENQNFLTSGSWPEIADAHPYLDQLLGIEGMRLGLTRDSITYASLGIPYKPFKRRIALPISFVSPLARIKGDYVTIHDGYDSYNQFKGRATKNWSLSAWKSFIKEFKRIHRGVKIIQLGGPNSRHIPGVDIDLIGATSFRDSLAILQNSRCHIDGDSGLVHSARILGVRSVVMYGPSPVDFFGYPENINIVSGFCGGKKGSPSCWWTTPDWMAQCPLGFETPECMDQIDPHDVRVGASTILEAK